MAWTVKAFLRRYPERAEEFFRRVREGRIEVTILYLNLTDLFGLDLLRETTDYAVELARRHDFELVTAMNDDVNGWAWGLPDLLIQRGIRYFDTAINETRSLGVRPRPSPFWWAGPGGNKVLLWHGESYLQGNTLGFDRLGTDDRVAEYLRRLEESSYPHHVIEMRVQGESHDNAPPGLWLCGMVRAWNASHAAPKLRLVTSRAWFEEVAAHWAGEIIEHRAGWPDWWADGNGTAALESALVRNAQTELATLKTLSAVTVAKPDPDRLERAREAAAFFCEHTWGAWCSTDEPDCLTSRAQWNTKAGYAYTAVVEARSLVGDALAAEARKTAGEYPGVLVFNPQAEARSGLVELRIADADIGLPSFVIMTPVRTEAGPVFHLADEETGAKVPALREPAIADSARRSAQTVRFMAADIPARGFRKFRIVPCELGTASRCGQCGGRLESPWVSIAPSADGAGVASIRDTRTNLEWIPAGGGYALGEIVYETIPGPFGREKLCRWEGIRRDCPFERTRVRFADPEVVAMPYGAGLRFRGQSLPGSLRSLTLDVRVYDALPRVDLLYCVEKTPETEAEALYAAFPLGGREPTVFLDVPGAVMRPGLDQVPGTAADWHSLERYFAVADNKHTTVVASPDIPCVQVNGINTGLWQERLAPHNGLVMSWVMNNYWFTNFPAAQGGKFVWRYSLYAWQGTFDVQRAARFAATICQPLVAVVAATRAQGPG